MYSYKLKNNVCVISIFHLYEAKKQNKKNWLVKSYCGRWSKKLTSGPGRTYSCSSTKFSPEVCEIWGKGYKHFTNVFDTNITS